MRTKGIELLIFDLDGTLVNSQYDIADGINQVLIAMNRATLSYKEVQKLIGGGVKKLVERALYDVSDKAILAQALQLFNEYYHNNLTTKTKPYVGVLEVLQNFPNLKKAVYSNKPHELTTRIIHQLELDAYFNHVQGSDQAMYKPKPSPDGINHILNKLNVLPQNTLMIGDSTHDIHAGKNAGVSTCAVTYGYRDEETLAKENPDFVIHQLTDLTGLIDAQQIL